MKRQEAPRQDKIEVSPNPDSARIGLPISSKEAGSDSGSESLESSGDLPEIPLVCPEGEMPFEEACVSKDKVRTSVERLDHKMIEEARRTDDVVKAADAYQALLEQQVVQAQAAEDDLDEIIQQLRQEQDQKKTLQATKKHESGGL